MTRRLARTFIALLLTAALDARAATAVVYVDAAATGAGDGTSWADAYTDLRTALLATTSGEIWVAAGVYTPDGPGGDRGATFALRSGVALYGGFAGHESERGERDIAANPTVLSGDLDGDDTYRFVNGHASFLNAGENSHHVVTADGTDLSAILDGFEVSHGYAYVSGFEEPPVSAGGGLLVTNGSALIGHTRFTGNAAPFGGAVGALDGSPVFLEVEFTENYADLGSGGAVYNDGDSHSRFLRCSFRANAAIGSGLTDGFGGAIYNGIGARLSVRSSDFVDNLTGFRTYSQSEDRTRGGAIASWGAALTIDRSRFFGNSSHLGGGVYAYDPQVVNSLFAGNQATDVRAVGLSAAGLGGALVVFGAGDIAQTTIVANRSADNGAGLYTSGDVTIANSVVWNNRITKAIPPGEDPVPLVKMQVHKGSGSLDIRYSDVEGLFEAIPDEDPPLPEDFPGSIDVDPLFVDPVGVDGVEGTEDDDLRLASGSPAIDAGENASVPSGVSADLQGHQRYADDPGTADTGSGTPPLVDMGAYEFGSAPGRCGVGFEVALLLPALTWSWRRRRPAAR